MNFTQPSRLQPGDKVAIISPSAGLPSLYPWVYELGLKRLKELFGLVPVEFPTACQSMGYLSDNPQARAQDINNAFADPSIKAIITTVGGNDQIRILPFLDADIIRANPKPLLGYSDCTNLHLYLWKLGIISYYGGALMTQFAMQGAMDAYTIDSIKKELFAQAVGQINAAPNFSDTDLDWTEQKNLEIFRPTQPHGVWQFHNGKNRTVKGRFWGGCLEILDMHLAVKKYIPINEEFSDIVLYIETSEEMPSAGSVYRFLAAMGELGILNKLQAILVARPKSQFLGTVPPEGKKDFIANQQKAIKSALHDYRTDIPVVFNLNFGHTDPQLLIPSGAMVTIDCVDEKISF